MKTFTVINHHGAPTTATKSVTAAEFAGMIQRFTVPPSGAARREEERCTP